MTRSQVYGHVDIGVDVDDDFLPVAKDAFVFLLVCINQHWKLPLGYFLIDSLNSEQQADFVKQCLVLLYDINCNVVSITFDGLSANLTMLKKLECSLELDNMKSTFPHPSNPSINIAVFLDLSHMLKLVRNVFREMKCLFSNNEKIDWDFIKALLKRQESKKLHLKNKLTVAHVDFWKNKMKVKLAAQLLSNTVADAIDYCNEKHKFPEFKNSEETVKFIRIFNNLFDVLNSRSVKKIWI